MSNSVIGGGGGRGGEHIELRGVQRAVKRSKTQAEQDLVHRRSQNILRNLPSRRGTRLMSSVDAGTAEIDSASAPTTLAAVGGRRRSSIGMNSTLRFRGHFENDAEHDDFVDAIATGITDQHPDLDTSEAQHKVDRTIKDIRVHLTVKRHIRSRILAENRVRPQENGFMDFLHSVSSMYAKAKHHAQLWKRVLTPFERIILYAASIHGSGAVKYFELLRWMILITIPVMFIALGFVVIPQWLYRSYDYNVSSGEALTFSDFISGSGWLANGSDMYYGAYYYSSITVINGVKYDMPKAYFFGLWGCFLFMLFIILFTFLHEYRKSYLDSGGDVKRQIIQSVFCGWDYQLKGVPFSTKQRNTPAYRKHGRLFNDFKELLTGSNKKQEKSRFVVYLVRFLLALVILVILLAAGFCVYLVSELSIGGIKGNESRFAEALHMSESRKELDGYPLLNDMVLALVINFISYVFPFFLVIIVAQMKLSPRRELYFTLASDLLLKLTTLVTLFYFWSTAISSETKTVGFCWETQLGQQIYRLIIVDFAFFLCSIIFNGLQCLMAVLTRGRISKPNFNVAQNTIYILYGQTIGFYYSPFILFMAWLKLLICIYLKWLSLMFFYESGEKRWRATHAKTTFALVMLIMYVVAVGCVSFAGYSIHPSKSCGPLRSYDSSYAVITNMINEWQANTSWLVTIINIVTSQGAIVAVVFFFGVLVYWQYRRAKAWRVLSNQMKEQLVLEGKDKQYLLNLMHEILALKIRRESAKPKRRGGGAFDERDEA